MTMISNAIYFTPADEYEDLEQFKLCPLILSSQKMYVSMISTITSMASLFLIAVLFRKSKP